MGALSTIGSVGGIGRRLVIAAAVLATSCPRVHGEIWWVDDDSFGGNGSRLYPFRTIPEALNAASDGDTIMVLDGRYYDTVDVLLPVFIIADPGGTAVIESDVWILADDVVLRDFVFRNEREPDFRPYYGVLIDGALRCSITGCTFHRYGVTIVGSEREHWTSHTIENNTVNGMPLRYYVGARDITVPVDTGQLILADCSNVTARGLSLQEVASGVQVAYGSGNRIEACDLRPLFGDGVIITSSSQNTLHQNEIHEPADVCVLLEGASGNHLLDNGLSSQRTYCIKVWNGSDENRLESNRVGPCRQDGISVRYDCRRNVVIGNRLRGAHSAAIQVEDECVDNVVVENDIQMSGRGIDIGRNTTGTLIQGNTIVEPDGQAIVCHSTALETSILDNVISRGGLDLWGLPEELATFIVSGNRVNGRPVYFFVDAIGMTVPGDAGQVFLVNCRECTIAGLSISETELPVHINGCSRTVIADNTLVDNSGVAIGVHYSEDTLVARNSALRNGVGVHARNSTQTTVVENTVVESFRGLVLYGGSRNLLADNVVSDSTEEGIHVTVGEKDSRIERNRVLRNGSFGIGIRVGSDNNVVANNEIRENAVGVFLFDAQGMRIAGNRVEDNAGQGIWVDRTPGNWIVGNTVARNGAGIVLDARWGGRPAIDNRIVHNSLIDNLGAQAVDPFEGNAWDLGYPGGGNHWSDFDEPAEGAFDGFRGPLQDEPGSDGVVDLGGAAGGLNPYLINGVRDRYPFIDPDGWRLRELGDLNCDGAIDAFDIEPFILALTDPAGGYARAHPDCDPQLADVDGNGVVDAFDIEPFVALLAGP